MFLFYCLSSLLINMSLYFKHFIAYFYVYLVEICIEALNVSLQNNSKEFRCRKTLKRDAEEDLNSSSKEFLMIVCYLSRKKNLKRILKVIKRKSNNLGQLVDALGVTCNVL